MGPRAWGIAGGTEVGKMRRWEGESAEVRSRNAKVGKEQEVEKVRRWEKLAKRKEHGAWGGK